MKLLQSILSDNNKIPVGSCFFLSAILSSVAFADNGKDAFPPTSLDQKITNTTITNPTATPVQPKSLRPQMALTPQNQFYPAQQMQPYQAYPSPYYYPQPQLQTYAPRQWGYYPQQFAAPYPYYQPYTQNGATVPIQQVYPNAPAYQPPLPPAITNNNAGRTVYPMRKKIKKEKHAWGDERHIWPDFYTDFTSDVWDKMINAPFDVGRMPGGWRAPSLSTPDPATVSDAVANQVPPIIEEMGNMTNFTN